MSKSKFLYILGVVWLLFSFTPFTIVPEGQRGILLRFGKLRRDEQGKVVLYEPGLHFKLPFVDVVRCLDSRLQLLVGNTDRFFTAEQKDLRVDYYVQWRIKDFGAYYKATNQGHRARAEELLRGKIVDRLRSEVGSRTISDIVFGSRGELMADAKAALSSGSDSIAFLGIEVVDVRVKQINLPKEVSASVHERMRAEREVVVTQHRSRGREIAAALRAAVDRKAVLIVAEAERNARRLRGEGEAEVAQYFISAFQNHLEFYRFFRSLKAYEASFSERDQLILHPDSTFFKPFFSEKGLALHD